MGTWDYLIASNIGLGNISLVNGFYLSKAPLLTCPEDTVDREVPGWVWSPPGPGEGIRSYAMSSPQSGLAEPYTFRGAGTWESWAFNTNPGVKMFQCDESTLLIVEYQPRNGSKGTNVAGFQCWSNCGGPNDYVASGTSVIHGRMQNWLFCDGHANKMNVADTYTAPPGGDSWVVTGNWARPGCR
ncbi:MAG TPA: hypothetical protein DET40_08160 [Lentisphaeria bacterium]|nr:MAG: hypothetical protein A2X45_10365 [Lentisphaerae bacterium GWF2_50_93]HCE43506.1 hypothetical protein [Lentisphaeria bacterium]